MEEQTGSMGTATPQLEIESDSTAPSPKLNRAARRKIERYYRSKPYQRQLALMRTLNYNLSQISKEVPSEQKDSE